MLPAGEPRYELHEPLLAGNELAYVSECVRENKVSTAVGDYIGRFEKQLADFTGAPAVVATMNGTAALHLCLVIAGVQAGDEVIVPALTFVATANAVAYCGAVPHFADCEERTLGVDPDKLRAHLKATTEKSGGATRNRATGRRVRALVVMHVFGHPSRIEALADVAREFELELIEDAAESLGSTTGGRHTGTHARIASLSFNGNKIVTTGGGGAVMVSDAKLAARVRHLATTAKLPHAWAFDHDELGYNYRLPNLNAALGCAQMEKLPDFLAAKRALADRYAQAFATVKGARFFLEPPGARSNYWLNCLLLDRPSRTDRDAILTAAHAAKYKLRPAWTLMHELPMYRSAPRMDLSTAEALENRIVNLPSGVALARKATGGAHG